MSLFMTFVDIKSDKVSGGDLWFDVRVKKLVSKWHPIKLVSVYLHIEAPDILSWDYRGLQSQQENYMHGMVLAYGR